MTDTMFHTTMEPNVKLVGGYGYMLRKADQWEHRPYRFPEGEIVRVKAKRLTPRHHTQYERVSLPSGEYWFTRTLAGNQVRVEISKHAGPWRFG